jgi:hypothetical protein
MLSQHSATSAGAVPRTMNGLRLSKLPISASAISPPFGAAGFTYGKWSKSGASLGLPSSA